MITILLVPLVLLLLIPSVIYNAISGVAWSIDGKPNDVDDDGVKGRSWEWGMKWCFGLAGPAVRHCLSDLWHDRKDWKHHLKGLMHVWIREYPKRASKLGAAVILLHWLAIALLAWRPWA